MTLPLVAGQGVAIRSQSRKTKDREVAGNRERHRRPRSGLGEPGRAVGESVRQPEGSGGAGQGIRARPEGDG